MDTCLESEPDVSPPKTSPMCDTPISIQKEPKKAMDCKRKATTTPDLKVKKPSMTRKITQVSIVSRKRKVGKTTILNIKKRITGQSIATPPAMSENMPKQQRQSKLVPIGSKNYITIQRYCGQPQINIRDYSADSLGKLYSTKRGIMLTPVEWKQLKDSFSSVDTFLEERQMKEKTLE